MLGEVERTWGLKHEWQWWFVAGDACSMEQIETYQNGDVYIFNRINLKNSFIYSFNNNIHAHPCARCVRIDHGVHFIVHILRNFENLCRSIQINTCSFLFGLKWCSFISRVHVCLCASARLCWLSGVFFIFLLIDFIFVLFLTCKQASGGIPLSNVDTKKISK